MEDLYDPNTPSGKNSPLLKKTHLFQYLTIVHKSSFVLGSNEQFFKFFFNILIPSVSFMLATLNNVVPGKFGINYYMCTGEDPSDYDILKKKVI